ncbi:MAG: DUF1697 domain-containing protein, partial [Gemmatimonadaceae bacterium]|nr:DUF1697 domain-containing protein [Gemmatimonadaceae bacterium]
FGALGFEDARTFIASGNVLFAARSDDAVALEHRIERHLEQALGYPVATFLRSPAQLALRSELDEVCVRDREIFWMCRTRSTDSAVSGARLEKALSAPATVRNVTTVRKLALLAATDTRAG